MIDAAFDFLKEELNAYLKREFDEATKDLVVYIENDIGKGQPTFKADAVNLLLANVEPETLMRPPDPYLQSDVNGKTRTVAPPLRLNLYALFAVGLKKYQNCLRHLSAVLRFFQANPVFTPQRHPRLPVEIDRLAVELHALSPAQQNEVWSSLKTAYMPSVLYKVKMIVLQDIPANIEREIVQIDQKAGNR